MRISWKSLTFNVELIKHTTVEGLATYHIYVFRDLSSALRSTGIYLVAVKRDKETLHFLRFRTMQAAYQTYLDYICRYA